MSLKICFESSAIMSGLSSLYANQQLTDIRLICSDGSLMAHKTVLAAVSDKFRDTISTDNTSNSGFIIFSGVSIEDIKTIIECVYFGHQIIGSNRFKQLTRIAEDFGIKLTSSVSAAFASTQVLPSMLSKSSANPLPAHKQSLILSGKKQSKRKAMETIQCSDKESVPADDMPMDLSVSPAKFIIEDNLQKIIDSVATNSQNRSQTPGIRRRKQLDPKPVLPKVVRFDELAETFNDSCHLEAVTEQFIEEDITEFGDFAKSFGDVITQSTPDPVVEPPVVEQNVAPEHNYVKFENNPEVISRIDSEVMSEPKIVVNNVPNSATKAKPVGKSPKSVSVSEAELLKDCCVCGKTHSSHRNLIVHLNKEHKTNDCFKCSICGKEQKYAKKFAIHWIQCQTTKV